MRPSWKLGAWCLLGVGLLSACGTPRPAPDASLSDAAASPEVGPDAVPSWACPAGWVASALGGCGPAVWLCAPDGGAAAGACAGRDLYAPPRSSDGDGGTSTGIYLRRDGGYAGGWREPGEPGGPPARTAAGTVVPGVGVRACAAGWLRQADGSCDPALGSACSAPSEALPGALCTATGMAACPPGEWADPGPEALGAVVVRVRAGASDTGADGSETRPFGTVQAAVSAAGDGGWVLLGAGSYAATLDVTRALHVLGRCAAAVTLSPTTGETLVVRASGSARVSLAGATLQGGGATAFNGASLRLERVVVQRAGVQALSASGSGTLLEGVDVVLRDTVASATDGATGQAALAFGSARLTLTRAAVLGNRYAGVHALGSGSRVELSDVLVRGTLASTRSIGGWGLRGESGGVVTAARAVVQENVEIAAVAIDAGSRVEVQDSVLRGTRPNASRQGGLGLFAKGGAVVASNVLLDQNTQAGAWAALGGSLELSDAVVRSTQRTSSGQQGFGLEADSQSRLVAQRVLVEDNAESGVVAFGAGTTIELSDVVVRGTRRTGSGLRGFGVCSQDGASVRATRVLVDSVRSAGFVAVATGTRLTLADSAVVGTVGQQGLGGYGIDVGEGATATATRVFVSENEEASIYVGDEGSALELTEALLRAPTARLFAGYGLNVERGASVRAARVALVAHRELGVIAFDDPTSVSLQDVLVDGVTSDPERGLGAGAYMVGGAHGTFERFALRDVAGAGVVAATIPVENLPSGSTFTGTDLFVRRVSPGTVQLRNATAVPSPAVSYALQSAVGCTVDVQNVYAEGAQFGVYDSAGTARLRRGIFAELTHALAVRSSLTDARGLVLEEVLRLGGASTILVDDSLPEASFDASRSCAVPPCM